MRKFVTITAITMLLIWACNKSIDQPDPPQRSYSLAEEPTDTDSMRDVLDSLNTSLYRRLGESEAKIRAIRNNGVEARTATYPIYE